MLWTKRIKWAIFLVITVALILIAFPRSSWNYTHTHTLTDGTVVSRTTHINQFGLPFEWIGFRYHTWFAVSDGDEVPVGDMEVCGFVQLELVWHRNRFRCGAVRFTLHERAARRDEVLLKTDPRANIMVFRWGMLVYNLSICLLPPTYIAIRLKQIRSKAARRRQRKGQCIQCGYNLTGNVSGVCPECGVKRDLSLF